MDKIVAQYAEKGWPDAKLEGLADFFKVDGLAIGDEDLANKIGSEIAAKIGEHLDILKAAYGDDLAKETVIFAKYKLKDASE